MNPGEGIKAFYMACPHCNADLDEGIFRRCLIHLQLQFRVYSYQVVLLSLQAGDLTR